MGRLFLVNLEGKSYSCKHCKTNLGLCDDVVSKISVIPGLLGLLVDLMIIIPSRVPVNETPVYFLIQDWLIGVVVLHIRTFLVRESSGDFIQRIVLLRSN
ncbi:unnamed protein product [Arabidopsis halleri]